MTVEEPDTTKKSTTLQSLENIGTSIGGHLLSSHSAQIMDINLKMSPVIAPHYLNYSHSRGLSYKMQFAAEYPTGKNSTLSLLPILGYNFKIKQFYYEAPLRYTYDKECDNYVELKQGRTILRISVEEPVDRLCTYDDAHAERNGNQEDRADRLVDLIDDLFIFAKHMALCHMRHDTGRNAH